MEPPYRTLRTAHTLAAAARRTDLSIEATEARQHFELPRRRKVILLVVITRADLEHGEWQINPLNRLTSGDSVADCMGARRGPFVAVQFTPQGADSAGALQGLPSDA